MTEESYEPFVEFTQGFKDKFNNKKENEPVAQEELVTSKLDDIIITTDEPVVDPLSKPLCVNDCGRKSSKNSKFCRKCNKDAEEKKEDNDYNEYVLENKDKIVNSMLSFHLSAYITLQMAAKFSEINLEGLPDKLLEQRDAITPIYEQIYDEYGPEELKNLISPLYLLAFVSLGHVGSAYIEGKKK